MGKRRWNLGRVSETAWRRMYRTDAHTKQNGRCLYCTRPITLKRATAEHNVPVSRGGQTRRDNIDAACEKCNKAKGKLTRIEFMKAITEPSVRNDEWALYLKALEIRMKRFTEEACKRIAAIR